MQKLKDQEMKKTEWKNVRGNVYVECAFVNGKLVDTSNKALPEIVAKELRELFPMAVGDNEEDTCFELDIEFMSSGYYDPGKIYGPPEDCYPPEGDDERELYNLVVASFHNAGVNEKTQKLSKQASEELFNLYEQEVKDAELGDWDDGPDEPDYFEDKFEYDYGMTYEE
jgi:hypothetical protein